MFIGLMHPEQAQFYTLRVLVCHYQGHPLTFTVLTCPGHGRSCTVLIHFNQDQFWNIGSSHWIFIGPVRPPEKAAFVHLQSSQALDRIRPLGSGHWTASVFDINSPDTPWTGPVHLQS